MMKHRSLVAMLLLATACTSPEPVRIGIVLDREGTAGAELAMEQINATGGIRGRPLALRVMSAGSTTAARPAIVAAESLSNDAGIIAVVGHSNSSASLAASQIYNARGVVQIAPTSSAPLLSRAGRYTFRLVASDIHQARFLADVITSGGAHPRTAVFFVNDDYGHALEHELRARLSDRHVSVVFESPYSEDDSIADAPAIARSMARVRPEVFVWLGRGPHLLQLIPALRQAMPSLRVLASDGIDNSAIESGADSTLAGVQYASFLELSIAGKALSDLSTHFHEKTGRQLAAEAALSYDAVMLLATAARDVGLGRSALRDYLASLGNRRSAFAGVTGRIMFDATGEPEPSYFLKRIAVHSADAPTRTPP
jgi:branched-chain amino acid transport system substrate-binding protein